MADESGGRADPEAYEAGRAAYRAQNNPPMPDDLVTKVGALLRPDTRDPPQVASVPDMEPPPDYANMTLDEIDEQRAAARQQARAKLAEADASRDPARVTRLREILEQNDRPPQVRMPKRWLDDTSINFAAKGVLGAWCNLFGMYPTAPVRVEQFAALSGDIPDAVVAVLDTLVDAGYLVWHTRPLAVMIRPERLADM